MRNFPSYIPARDRPTSLPSRPFSPKRAPSEWARVIKFFTGWNSHLYYWIYTGLMVGVTAILAGWLAGQVFPNTFSGTYNSPLFMWLFCIVFSLGVGYIAYRGVNGTTAVNMAINVIQITALIAFAIMAIAYRSSHGDGKVGLHLSNGTPVNYNVAQVNVTDDKGKPVQDTWADDSPKVDEKTKQPIYKQQDRQVTKDDLDKTKNKSAVELAGLTAMGLGEGDPYPVWKTDDKGKVILDKDGAPTADPFILSYKPSDAWSGAGTKQDPTTFNLHPNAASVVAPHGFGSILIQACVAILLLVGFESVSAMGEEAKNPKKDIGRAILLSLVIQGAMCYLFEYFAANYFLNSGYTTSNAGASGAPIGDMMILVGTWAFGSYSAGKAFMLIEAFTVFLALIGTTLSCMNTGARVTYAMGRDEEVPTQFGMLHGTNLSPHRSVWFLACISIVVGILTTVVYLGGQSRTWRSWKSIEHNFWYSIGIFSPHAYVTLPNSGADHHADQQLRHVPALYDDLHRGHGGVPRTPQLPRLQTHAGPVVRPSRQLRLHVVLLARPDSGHWRSRHECQGTLHRPHLRRPLDHRRGHLFLDDQQVQRKGDNADLETTNGLKAYGRNTSRCGWPFSCAWARPAALVFANATDLGERWN